MVWVTSVSPLATNVTVNVTGAGSPSFAGSTALFAASAASELAGSGVVGSVVSDAAGSFTVLDGPIPATSSASAPVGMLVNIIANTRTTLMTRRRALDVFFMRFSSFWNAC